MFKKTYYGAHIAPACAYCLHGSTAADPKMILCKRKGVVSPYYCCRKFSYDPLMLDGIADSTAKYATARANGALNIVFNGIWSRKTEYFTVPSGLLSIYGCGTTDGGAQKFKVSLWKKVDGGAQYVDNTTFYFTADGQNYHCDIDNLDPNASYRVTISYDSSRYYLYGLMKVEGIG